MADSVADGTRAWNDHQEIIAFAPGAQEFREGLDAGEGQHDKQRNDRWPKPREWVTQGRRRHPMGVKPAT